MGAQFLAFLKRFHIVFKRERGVKEVGVIAQWGGVQAWVPSGQRNTTVWLPSFELREKPRHHRAWPASKKGKQLLFIRSQWESGTIVSHCWAMLEERWAALEHTLLCVCFMWIYEEQERWEAQKHPLSLQCPTNGPLKPNSSLLLQVTGPRELWSILYCAQCRLWSVKGKKRLSLEKGFLHHWTISPGTSNGEFPCGSAQIYSPHAYDTAGRLNSELWFVLLWVPPYFLPLTL